MMSRRRGLFAWAQVGAKSIAAPARQRTLHIPQEKLLELANRWEPEASASPPGYRKATCVSCAAPMVEMWHIWLHEGGFKKEIHLCMDCARPWLA